MKAMMTHTPCKRSILIVDDADDGREMLVVYLTSCGFQVSEARDGAEAMDVVRRIQPDIILMDLSLPVVDGWEATRELKADPRTKHIVIIAMTGHAFPSEQDAARAAGCDAIIVKPFDVAVLAIGLDRLLSQGLATFDARGVTITGAEEPPFTARSLARGWHEPVATTTQWVTGASHGTIPLASHAPDARVASAHLNDTAFSTRCRSSETEMLATMRRLTCDSEDWVVRNGCGQTFTVARWPS